MKSLLQASSGSLDATQFMTDAPTLAAIMGSIGCYLDGFGVDEEIKRKWDDSTSKSVAECDIIKNGDFSFHSARFYARPISAVGAHNTTYDEKMSQEENKSNAEKASRGYHHGLLILSFGDPVPTLYLLDRVEGVRFIPYKMVENELKSGHLALIKTYSKLNIKYKEIKKFIQIQSKKDYNVLTNNCLHFVYEFIKQILKKSKWETFPSFWKFISSHFRLTDIKNGKYNKQQNHFEQEIMKRKLKLEAQIRTNNSDNIRGNWSIGDKVLIKSLTCASKNLWSVGEITHREFEVDDHDSVIVSYQIDDYVFTRKKISIMSEIIKPYIEIPQRFLDPVTNKIMTDPTQILRSGTVYDAVTVQYMQKCSYNIDPINGQLI
eukprot:451697_1